MKPTSPRPSAQAPDVDIVEVGDMSEHQTRVALRTLANLMVRAHAGKGDPVAIAGDKRAASALTVARHPSPHPDEDAAA